MSSKKPNKHENRLPPSQRTLKPFIKAPEGCVDLWQVVVAYNIYPYQESKGVYMDRDAALRKADKVWNQDPGLRVDIRHRAGIVIGDKVHFVNIPSVTITPATELLIEEPTDA